MKTKLLFFLATVFIISNLYGQYTFDSCLVAYYPFSGNANDQSIYNNHGIVHGAILTYDRFGNPDMAYTFDGVDDNIVVNNNTAIDFQDTDNFTITFWMKTNTQNYGFLLCKQVYGYWNGYAFIFNNTDPGYCLDEGHITLYVAAGAQDDACSDDLVNNNKWIFIAGVYNSNINTSTLYVNGEQQADIGTRVGSVSNIRDLKIGSHSENLGYYCGAIDDIRIYNCTLDSSAIQDLYNELNSSIGELNNSQQINIFPNPTNDLINIETKGIEINKIEIYNLLGSKIRTFNESIDLINIYDLKNGVYIIKIYDTKGKSIKFEKIIKN